MEEKKAAGYEKLVERGTLRDQWVCFKTRLQSLEALVKLIQGRGGETRGGMEEQRERGIHGLDSSSRKQRVMVPRGMEDDHESMGTRRSESGVYIHNHV